MKKQPDIIFVFADQWRAQAAGYAGNTQIKTPNIDALASRSVNMVNAYSGCPVCTPYRAGLITGQQPLTHGLFLNDIRLGNNATSIGQAFKNAGYDTAYIGKWHLEDDRDAYIPPERRQGFDYWKVRNCTHQYLNSMYYDQNDPEWKAWDGYDALAQTRDAVEYFKQRNNDEKPAFMMLSWGVPHSPYHQVPDRYKAMYPPEEIELRPNVPPECADDARRDLSGYYAHCSAMDDCIGMLTDYLEQSGRLANTIVVLTSDHGDMLFSQGQIRKQKPWAESCRVPFLLSWPERLGTAGRECPGFIDAPDIMPTLLDLADISIPDTVEGKSFAAHMQGGADPSDGCGMVACYSPFGEFTRAQGGREYRALITETHTYARTLDGPWLLYDDAADPYQMTNLVNRPEAAAVQQELDAGLQKELAARNDGFLPGPEYIKQWNYTVNENGTIACPSKTG